MQVRERSDILSLSFNNKNIRYEFILPELKLDYWYVLLLSQSQGVQVYYRCRCRTGKGMKSTNTGDCNLAVYSISTEVKKKVKKQEILTLISQFKDYRKCWANLKQPCWIHRNIILQEQQARETQGQIDKTSKSPNLTSFIILLFKQMP